MTVNVDFLRDVASEHVEEAEFLPGQWRNAAVSPRINLETLQKTIERRLAAHLEGLAIGGEPVAERHLWPTLDPKGEATADGVAAAALALMLGLEPDTTNRLIETMRTTDSDSVRSGLVCAFQITNRADIDEPLRMALYACHTSPSQVAFLKVLASRAVSPGPIMQGLLAGHDLDVVRAALSLVPLADPAHGRYAVDELLTHAAPPFGWPRSGPGSLGISSPPGMPVFSRPNAERPRRIG